MAKKRSTRSSSTRSSSRSSTRGRRRRGAGGEPAWKNSKPLAFVLIILIIGSLMYMLLSLNSSSPGNQLPENFPRTYLSEDDNGKVEAVLVKRGKRGMKVPFEENGKKYWDAYICLNEKCPGRKKTDGKPYIFAGVYKEIEQPDPNDPNAPPPMDFYNEVNCPECKIRYEKVSKKFKARYMPTNIDRYQTDEAKEMIKKLREEIKKRKGK